MENFAKKLIKVRKEKNLKIEDIAEQTKIRHQIITAFENGEFDVLPPVYAKSFLKTHASFLGFSDNEIEKAISEIFEVRKETPLPQQESEEIIKEEKQVKTEGITQKTAEPEKTVEKPKEEAKFESRKLDGENLDSLFFGSKEKRTSKLKAFLKYAGLGIIGVAAVIFVIILFMPDEGKNANTFVKEGDKVEDTLDNASPNIVSDMIKLTARAIDTTSFKIHVDNQTDESITLYPDKSKDWQAEEKFELSGVTVGEVEFIRDGVVLEPFGNKGSIVRNITIYKDRVVSSSVDVEETPDSNAVISIPDTSTE